MQLKDLISKTVYISGPMSGLDDFGSKDFYDMETKLRAFGFSSIKNPVHIGELYGYDKPHNFYMKKAISMLLEADLIYVFGNYTKSKGVALEIDIAQKLGIPVFYQEYEHI